MGLGGEALEEGFVALELRAKALMALDGVRDVDVDAALVFVSAHVIPDRARLPFGFASLSAALSIAR